MLPAVLRNALISVGMFIITIIVMFLFPVTREFIIRTATIFSLTKRVCENVQTQGDVIYTVKTCREDLNLFGKTYSVSESF